MGVTLNKKLLLTKLLLTLFSLYEKYYKHLLFVLVSIFYLHGNFEGSAVGRGSLQFLLLIDAG